MVQTNLRPLRKLSFNERTKNDKVQHKGLKTLTPDVGMSIFSCQAVSVMLGEMERSVFLGFVNPQNYETKEFEKTFNKSGTMEEVTLLFPRNEEIDHIEVLIPDGAKIEAPTPYKCGKALFYGSSITEGGCCTTVTNNYVALLSRWLDLDFFEFLMRQPVFRMILQSVLTLESDEIVVFIVSLTVTVCESRIAIVFIIMLGDKAVYLS